MNETHEIHGLVVFKKKWDSFSTNRNSLYVFVFCRFLTTESLVVRIRVHLLQKYSIQLCKSDLKVTQKKFYSLDYRTNAKSRKLSFKNHHLLLLFVTFSETLIVYDVIDISLIENLFFLLWSNNNSYNKSITTKKKSKIYFWKSNKIFMWALNCDRVCIQILFSMKSLKI